MQVGAEDLAILGERAVAAPIEVDGGTHERLAARHARVDLVTSDGRVFERQYAPHIPELLVALQHGRNRQEPEPRAAARLAFEPKGVMDRLAQHLEAAAEPDELAALAQVAQDGLLPRLRAQPGEIGADAL